MADPQSRREKLKAMAKDRSSPNEAAVARSMLEMLEALELEALEALEALGAIRKVERSGQKTRPRPEFDRDWADHREKTSS